MARQLSHEFLTTHITYRHKRPHSSQALYCTDGNWSGQVPIESPIAIWSVSIINEKFIIFRENHGPIQGGSLMMILMNYANDKELKFSHKERTISTREKGNKGLRATGFKNPTHCTQLTSSSFRFRGQWTRQMQMCEGH